MEDGDGDGDDERGGGGGGGVDDPMTQLSGEDMLLMMDSDRRFVNPPTTEPHPPLPAAIPSSSKGRALPLAGASRALPPLPQAPAARPSSVRDSRPTHFLFGVRVGG